MPSLLQQQQQPPHQLTGDIKQQSEKDVHQQHEQAVGSVAVSGKPVAKRPPSRPPPPQTHSARSTPVKNAFEDLNDSMRMALGGSPVKSSPIKTTMSPAPALITAQSTIVADATQSSLFMIGGQQQAFQSPQKLKQQQQPQPMPVNSVLASNTGFGSPQTLMFTTSSPAKQPLVGGLVHLFSFRFCIYFSTAFRWRSRPLNFILCFLKKLLIIVLHPFKRIVGALFVTGFLLHAKQNILCDIPRPVHPGP